MKYAPCEPFFCAILGERRLIFGSRRRYNAACPSLITFYGAFYREGCITIVLEHMVRFYVIHRRGQEI